MNSFGGMFSGIKCWRVIGSGRNSPTTEEKTHGLSERECLLSTLHLQPTRDSVPPMEEQRLKNPDDDESLSSSSSKPRRKHKRKKDRRHKRRRRRSSTPSPPRGVVSDDDADNESIRKPKRRRTTTKPRDSKKTPQQSVSSKHRDDSVGHYQGEKGSTLEGRYRVLSSVGMGTFGKVWECLDLQRKTTQKPFCAIKVVRNIKRYHDAALVEAKIIDSVNRRGGRGLSHCVILRDAFALSSSGHYCLVFESLGPSLYDFLQKHQYRAFPMVCLQDFAVQLLETLEFLHGFGLIHTDLKIENILLMNDKEVTYRGSQRIPECTRLKLIDFGGACYDHDKKSSIINTRQYRAPEVILGVGWSMPSDMWSLGCILVELYRGELLFPTHDNEEHLALMERIIGFFPHRMIDAAKYDGTQQRLAHHVFDSESCHRMERLLTSDEVSFVRQSKRLDRLVRPVEDAWFLDLVARQLVLDPRKRWTAHECLSFLKRIGRHTTHATK